MVERCCRKLPIVGRGNGNCFFHLDLTDSDSRLITGSRVFMYSIRMVQYSAVPIGTGTAIIYTIIV
jgi:hypothetical protein